MKNSVTFCFVLCEGNILYKKVAALSLMGSFCVYISWQLTRSTEAVQFYFNTDVTGRGSVYVHHSLQQV